MVFRKTTYTFNCWKEPKDGKNIRFRKVYLSIFNMRGALGVYSFLLGNLIVTGFSKKLIRENQFLYKKFEDKKLKQISNDYHIYSISMKNANNKVEEFSYV